MPFEHLLPYTNFHELNLDWCIAELKKLNDRVNNLVLETTRYNLEPVQDPAALAVELSNGSRKIRKNAIMWADTADGWTDLPTGATTGIFANINIKGDFAINGNDAAIGSRSVQLFIDDVTPSLSYRTVWKQAPLVIVVSAWNTL